MVKRRVSFLTSVSISFSVASSTTVTFITHVLRLLLVKNPSIIVKNNPTQPRRCSGTLNRQQNLSTATRHSNDKWATRVTRQKFWRAATRFEIPIPWSNPITYDEHRCRWDYGENLSAPSPHQNLIAENCPAPTSASGYAIVNNTRSVAQTRSNRTSPCAQSPSSSLRTTIIRGFLDRFSSRVTVTMEGKTLQMRWLLVFLLRLNITHSSWQFSQIFHFFSVDMLAHAINNPAPSTTILISGNRDFAYALSILRLRNYRIVLITLSNAYPSLRAQGWLDFWCIGSGWSKFVSPTNFTSTCKN